MCDGRSQTQAVVWLGDAFSATAPVLAHGRPLPTLVLGAGLIKGERQDWLIEKASELGVDAFVPLTLDHCVVRLRAATEKQARWQAIADSALEQCGRTWQMAVAPAQTLASWLAAGAGWFADETGGQPWAGLAAAPRGAPLRVALGPEGGWSSGERALLASAGAQAISVGPLVLRAETAALAVAAIARCVAQEPAA